MQMEMTPRGLLVRGGPDWDSRQSQRGFTVRGTEPGGKRFLDLLDPATAQSRWPKRDKPIEVTSPFVRQGDAVYAATREKLYRVTLENGDAHELATFKFEAGDRAEGEDAQQEQDDRDGQEQVEQDAGDVRGAGGDAGEAEQGRDQRNDREHDGPSEQ